MAFLSEDRPTTSLVPRYRKLTYSDEQVMRTAQIIKRSGFNAPILLDEGGVILVGYAQYAAAKAVGLSEVPCVLWKQMTEAAKHAYVIAEYKLALDAGWDEVLLAEELGDFFEGAVTAAGSHVGPVSTHRPASVVERLAEEDMLPPSEGQVVTRPGDLWLLGAHRLLCGEASDPAAHASLMGQERAQMVFADPLSSSAGAAVEGRSLAENLRPVFALLNASTCDGGAIFACSDWKHMRVVLEAGEAAFGGLKDLVVWIRRESEEKEICSGHELIFVFQKSCFSQEAAPDQRSRHPSVDFWRWPGIEDLRPQMEGHLVLQPLLKPTALFVAAIEDCTDADDVVLDAVCGAGTMLIAAELTGRRARAFEGDPASCDRAIRRWQAFSQQEAILSGTGKSFRALED